MRASEVVGAYRVTVLTEPTPLRTGRADISVLVQDRASGEPERAVRVDVRAAYRGSPAWQRGRPYTPRNRLYHGARLNLDRAGRWRLQVRLHGQRGPARLTLQLPVGAAPPRWLSLWPWLSWPIVPIGAACGWLRRQLRQAERARAKVA